MNPSPDSPRRRGHTRPTGSVLALATAVAALVAALLAGFLVSCEPSSPETEEALPPVILISLDTTRADLFTSYADRESSLTPHFDALAADSVVFENAFAQIPHTLPSHMSLFTSLYPDVHGVKPEREPLLDHVLTLTQRLQDAGYRTLGRASSEWLKPEFGYGRGYDDYAVLPHEPTYADRVNAAAEELLDGYRRRSGPLFLFLHYYDLHSDFEHGALRNKLPYYSPPEYREHLPVSGDGREFCDADGECNTRYLLAADRERRHVPAEEIELIHGLYEAAMPLLDEEMGRLFEMLRDAGLYDDALIVVTADHAEEFREHGRFIHSQPYQETVHVPLLVKFPGNWRAGTRVEPVAETIDVLPTILDFLELEPLAQAQGESLMPLLRDDEEGGGGGREKDAVAHQDSINQTRYALRTLDRLVIIDFKTGGHRELYDLTVDEAERRNLAEERPAEMAEMEERLKQRLRENRALAAEYASGGESTGGQTLSPEERERLKALGYLN